jgi:hypothetical protein
VSLDIFFGNTLDVTPLPMGAVDNLIVDIREILDEGNIKTEVLQIFVDDVEDNCRTGVADMTEIINRYPAGVNADLSGFDRLKSLFLPRKRIVNSQRHIRAPWKIIKPLKMMDRKKSKK